MGSHAEALQGRDDLMREKMEEARVGVQKSLRLSAENYQKALAENCIVEYSDSKTFGVNYNAPKKPLPHQCMEGFWAKKTLFNGVKHNRKDPNQAHFELAWGSLDGSGIKCKPDQMIEACVGLLTHVR